MFPYSSDSKRPLAVSEWCKWPVQHVFLLLFGRLLGQTPTPPATPKSREWRLTENGCVGRVPSLIYTIFRVWGVSIMPITSDYWMLLLSNHFLISPFLNGRTHKNCYYVYFKAFVMGPWRGRGWGW